MKTLRDYYNIVSVFSRYPKEIELQSFRNQCIVESAEVLGVLDKGNRIGYDVSKIPERMIDELGDVCWGLVMYTSVVRNDFLDVNIDDFHYSREDVQLSNERRLNKLISMATSLSSFGSIAINDIIHMMKLILIIAADYNKTLWDVMEYNVNKLCERNGVPNPLKTAGD